MELDASIAIVIGIYQLMESLFEVIRTKKVNATMQYVVLSLLAGFLWLSYQYRTGMNATAWITILGLIVNLYMLRVIYLKDKEDKKI